MRERVEDLLMIYMRLEKLDFELTLFDSFFSTRWNSTEGYYEKTFDDDFFHEFMKSSDDEKEEVFKEYLIGLRKIHDVVLSCMRIAYGEKI